MPITPQLLALNPLKDSMQVNKIDYTADFDNLFLFLCYNVLKYIPRLAKLGCEGQLYSTETKRNYVDDTYKGKKVTEFDVQFKANHCSTFQNVYPCFPIKIKAAADNNNGKAAGVIRVNNFFAHLIKEIVINKYGDDIPILPLTNMVDIQRYSDEM